MKYIISLIMLFLFNFSASACSINQLVGDTNNGVNWPASGPVWGQSFAACETGDVWEIAFWPHAVTTGMHTLILTDINCVTMWTVNNINLSTSGGNPVTVDLATGSGTSRAVISGNSYIFQLIGPAGSNLQMWLTFSEPYPAGQDKTDGCLSYSLDWWFRVGINEPLSPLPIELSTFDAKVIEKGNAVELNFETELEIGASHFGIENSPDGRSFETVGIVEAAGNSNLTNAYKFIHRHPYDGQNYYRLKQVDEDGSYEYSKIVQVHVKRLEISYRVMPNPTQGDFNIYLNQAAEKELSIHLFNLRGEKVSSQKLAGNTTQISIDGSLLPTGVYIIQVVDNVTILWVEKVLKQ